MIRIYTKIGNMRVKTLFISGKWVTLVTGQQYQDSNSLMEAGDLHIRMANELREKLKSSESRTENSTSSDGITSDSVEGRNES